MFGILMGCAMFKSTVEQAKDDAPWEPLVDPNLLRASGLPL